MMLTLEFQFRCPTEPLLRAAGGKGVGTHLMRRFAHPISLQHGHTEGLPPSSCIISGGSAALQDRMNLSPSETPGRSLPARERSIMALVSAWSWDRAELVARAFTVYFHLVNLAEEEQRVRALSGA